MTDSEDLTFIDEIPGHEQTLYSRAVKGGAWIFALRIFIQVLSYVRYIILLRVLAVADMGLLGVALLLMQTLDTFTNTGFRAALIQKKDKIQKYLDTVWTVGLVRAAVLFVILYFCAPLLAGIKVPAEKVSLTIAVIRVTGLSFFVTALANVGTVYFQKELRFKSHFILHAASSLVGIAVTIFLALVYKSVWALVFGKLTNGIVRCILSYILLPGRLRFRIDFPKARELWIFGKWVFGGSALVFLLTQGDDFFVWGYLGITSLAFYQMAYKFSNMPATEISNIIGHITFPAYSKLQDDIPRLKNAYLKVLQFTAFLTVPVAGLIFVLAPDFVLLFLTEKWLPIVLPMQILTIQGLLSSLGGTRGPLFSAVGRPAIITKLHVIRFIILVILIYPMTARWNIVGTSLTIVIVILAVTPLAAYMSMKIINCTVFEILKPVLYPFVATSIMMAVICLFKFFVFCQVSFVSFFFLVVVGFCVYGAVLYCCDLLFNYKIKDIIVEQLAVLFK